MRGFPSLIGYIRPHRRLGMPIAKDQATRPFKILSHLVKYGYARPIPPLSLSASRRDSGNRALYDPQAATRMRFARRCWTLDLHFRVRLAQHGLRLCLGVCSFCILCHHGIVTGDAAYCTSPAQHSH
jgi:hypothetical protein